MPEWGRGREREGERERKRERERERLPSGVCAVNTEPDMELDPINSEIMT